MKFYIACPYSHPDPKVRQERFYLVTKKAAELTRAGMVVFSPITHSHYMAENFNLPMDWEYWKQVDRSFIEWCDTLIVLELDGWQRSRGVNEEIRLAKELKKAIFYIDP